MKYTSSLANNLWLLLAYNIVSHLVYPEQYDALAVAITLCFAIGIHTIVLVILAIYSFVVKDNEMGRKHLIAALVILVIGFSTCFGGMTLREELF